MSPIILDEMIRRGYITPRSRDVHRIKSLISSSEKVASAAMELVINDKNATMIFRELYECIRQLGDALWCDEGYESISHEASMKILTTVPIQEAFSLNKVDRFRKIRNDMNYRGYLATPEQAKEIINFWKRCSRPLIEHISRKIK